ncbi:GNAT family N-acetyltransferase [Acidicapsa dinghuensis]|uniref:GNAT family N-acetyltransferase n=1 Tax=Acidicapsa dinghuensis TaxID=2218256 RepID=A0ABW1EQ47_9BACT|nr:GNAT family N-acetyltransferase [Acidicapsa dinghuensis]
MDLSEKLLDNPIWNSLRTHLAYFSEGGELARRFQAKIGPLAGLKEQSTEAYAELRSLLKSGEYGVLFLADEPRLPEGWKLLKHGRGDQMICRKTLPVPLTGFEIVPLGPNDVPEMLSLTQLTDPGPFRERTIELGAFFGVRQNGRLAAMAGQRLSMPGFVEVSGVCTHPDFRGHGYAQALVAYVTALIQRRGDTPILHVYSKNDSAIRVYERLGYTRRWSAHVAVITPLFEGQQ